MIISRTPLRITLGGGGTDLPGYYEKFGGYSVTAAINKYVYVAVTEAFENEYFLKYSKIERVKELSEIEHPIIREVFRYLEVPPGIDVASFADIPAGTGLGSSAAFTVGLIHALSYYLKRTSRTNPHRLAELAASIEMDVLRRPTGKQDQYACSLGGVQELQFWETGEVVDRELALSITTKVDLSRNILFFFTGHYHETPEVIAQQEDMTNYLHAVKKIGVESARALKFGDMHLFASLLSGHWELKQKQPGVSNERIDSLYTAAMGAGALGGKLVGSGAGGFFLFYVEQKDQSLVKKVMAAAGAKEVKICLERKGTILQGA